MKLTSETVKHSPIGASSMERWANCPGSVRLSKDIPNVSSSYAEEGTYAHTLASEWLQGKFPPDNCDPEMRGHIETYVNFIQKLWDDTNHVDDKHFVEHSFDLSEIFPGLYGTADDVIYDAKKRHLHVSDFKYGAGIPVSPVQNVQLLYYGVGALLSLGLPVEKITLHIIQPRCNADEPVKSWETDPLTVMEFIADLKMYAEETVKPDARLVLGEHCRFCPAKQEQKCPALLDNVKKVAKMDFANEVKIADSAGVSVSPDTLASYLALIPALEAWIKGVHEYSYKEAQVGRFPTGYKLVPKRAMRKWADASYAEKRLNQELNPQIMLKCLSSPELLSPAQVEKIIGAKTNAALLQELTVKISSGDNLVPDTDPRPAVNKQDAISSFNDEAEIANLLS